MKKYAILLGITFIFGNISLQSQDSIPNNNFESWNSNTSPTNWSTVNDLLPLGFFACNQTTNSYEGTYALSMKTIDLDGMLVPAVVSLGTVGMGFTEGGIPFSGRPESLKGYFKHPSNGDAVMLFIQFYKEGIEMGSGYWSTSDSVTEFTMFEAPITFASPLNPDTMNITMITDQNVMGSNMIIDALQFEYTPVRIRKEVKSPVNIYPNPCNDFITIKTDAQISAIEITNLSGGKVLNKENVGTQEKIDLQKLDKGYYILNIRTGNAVYSKKIIKQ